MILFALVLILLLIFILQNGKDVTISFLGANGSVPLAVAMLFSAVAGALLVAIPGVGRILQLRKMAKHGGAPTRPARSGRATGPPPGGMAPRGASAPSGASGPPAVETRRFGRRRR